jgi:glycosyltransferase involved in cell wall biosynthesis
VTAGSLSLQRLAAPHVPAGRLVRLPLGVDTELFSPGPPLVAHEPLARGAVRLLCVGSLTPVKDHATLLRALVRIAERVPDVHLHIVGDGPLRGEMARRGEALGVARRVSFHGGVPHDRLPDYYRAADVLVLSSRYESQAMVVLEAAACGCPVVGTAVGVLPELPGARAVPVGDVAALADVVVAAVSERGAVADDGRTSLDAARREFRLQRTVDELCSLYRQLLRSGDGAEADATPV